MIELDLLRANEDRTTCEGTLSPTFPSKVPKANVADTASNQSASSQPINSDLNGTDDPLQDRTFSARRIDLGLKSKGFNRARVVEKL